MEFTQTSSKSSPFRENIIQIVNISLVGFAWCLFIISAQNYKSETWFLWLIYSRIFAAMTAFTLVGILSFRRVKNPNWDTAFLLLSLALQASHGALEAPTSKEFYGYTGILFLLVSLSYRGAFNNWLKFYFPLSFAMVVTPIFFKASTMKTNIGNFVDNFSLAISGVVLGIIVARINSTKHQALLRYVGAQREMLYLGAQVAHDIRSPLAALATAEKDFAVLPEETRVLIRSAVSRIQDIANQLLEKNRLETKSDLPTIKTPRQLEESNIIFLSDLIENIISEKRLQYRSKIGIEIIGRLACSSYGIFAKIQATEFKRVLSNLVNNSVEALGEKGKVTISLEAAPDNQIQILVMDNGKGIPQEILTMLGNRGETYDKAGGSGLGLFHARTSVERWGGKLELKSEVGHGTSAVITLPKAEAPEWFVAELRLSPHSQVVVLDDDESIHRIWDGRAESAMLGHSGIKLQHFSTPVELRNWKAGAEKTSEKTQYLLDYELLGFEVTGLDLAEELGIAGQSILITSRYEERAIRERCLRLKVPLIPKGMAGFVPIKVWESVSTNTQTKLPAEEKIKLDAILIDDDELMQMSWKISAKQKGIRFLGFTTVKAFLEAAHSFDYATSIYIDSLLGKDDLGNEIRGEEQSKQISEMGFRKIYLATGLAKIKTEQLLWLAGVRGKEPPWMES